MKCQVKIKYETTKGFASFVWPRLLSSDLARLWGPIKINSCGCIFFVCLFLCNPARDQTWEPRTRKVVTLSLGHNPSCFFLKYIVVNVCTEKADYVKISFPFLFTQPFPCILFGVVTQNTENRTFFNFYGYTLNMLSLFIYFHLTRR